MHIHVVAVSGTGMGSLAGLLKELGHDVSGSDVSFNPPDGPCAGAVGRALRARLRSGAPRARAGLGGDRQRVPPEQRRGARRH
ncbi:MAG: Mur ligase domain-containing protein [Polyangiaceae bacterium]